MQHQFAGRCRVFHTLIDGELFLPESWSNDRPRCQEAGIPDTMVYRPKSTIALELYDRAVTHGVHFEWLTFDEWYGSNGASPSQVLRGIGTLGGEPGHTNPDPDGIVAGTAAVR